MKYIQICIFLLLCIACNKEPILPENIINEKYIGTHDGVLSVINKGVSVEGDRVEDEIVNTPYVISLQRGTDKGTLLLHHQQTTVVLKAMGKNHFGDVFVSYHKDCSILEEYTLSFNAIKETIRLEYILESNCAIGKLRQEGSWRATCKKID
jgi:hypothetical protein